MADRNPQSITGAGVTPTAHAASSGGDTVPADCIVRVTNDGESSITMTLVTPGTVDGDLAVADRAITVPAGASRYVRPSRAAYASPSTGRVSITWSAVTDVTIEVIQ